MTQPKDSESTVAVVDGQPLFGVRTTPFARANLLDARFPGFTGATRWLRKQRLKEWQHVAVVHPDYYMSLALVDAKYTTTSFVCAFNRRSGETNEHSRQAPPGVVRLPEGLGNGDSAFFRPNYLEQIKNRLDQGYHEVTVDIAATRQQPRIKADLRLAFRPGVAPPLVAVLPLASGRPFYTHKAPLAVSGRVSIGEIGFELDPGRDLALIDVHKAYYPYRTFWHWATFAAYDQNGGVLGANLTHNVIADDHKFNENVMWHAGRLHRLGPARFDIPDDPLAPWRVRTTDGRAELQFHPEGLRQETINLGFAKSEYEQPFGCFSGTLEDDDGVEQNVHNVFGVAERHQVRW